MVNQREVPTFCTEQEGGMAYELREGGRVLERFGTQAEAEAAARAALQRDSNAEPEIIDIETGRAVQPGGSMRWREELAKKIGY